VTARAWVIAVLGLLALAEVALLLALCLPPWPPPPPVADQPPTTLRRLEIRLHADLDKPNTRGDRYRLFECREVPRGR
jgi:hypothetical protein